MPNTGPKGRDVNAISIAWIELNPLDVGERQLVKRFPALPVIA
jgi:hypothetical protein